MSLVGKFHLYRKQHIGEIIAHNGYYVLIKYSFGQYCINSSSIKKEQIFDENPFCKKIQKSLF